MNSTNSLTRTVQSGLDTTIHYTLSGRTGSQVLVFIHGWACRRTDFIPLIRHLPTSWLSVSVDLAEHGDSRSNRHTWAVADFAEDVAAVLEKEGLENVTVVGHSMGGAVALELARQRPATVRQIIGLDSLHHLERYPKIAEDHIARYMEPFNETFPEQVRKSIEASSLSTTDIGFKNEIFEKMSSARLPAALLAMEGLLRWDMDSVLTEVQQSIDVLVARDLFDPRTISRFGSRINYRPVDLGGHHFLLEQPKATAALVAELVKSNGKSGTLTPGPVSGFRTSMSAPEMASS